MCVHVCVCVCVCACVCVHVCVCVCTHTHTRIHTYTRTRTHPHTHLCLLLATRLGTSEFLDPVILRVQYADYRRCSLENVFSMPGRFLSLSSSEVSRRLQKVFSIEYVFMSASSRAKFVDPAILRNRVIECVRAIERVLYRMCSCYRTCSL